MKLCQRCNCSLDGYANIGGRKWCNDCGIEVNKERTLRKANEKNKKTRLERPASGSGRGSSTECDDRKGAKQSGYY